MTIYLDYVFFINFLFDFILLLGINIIKKRNIGSVRLILGSVFGGLSFFILFIPLGGLLFFLLKILFGVFMILITFGYKSISYTINNLLYLIVLSIILGGSLYLINIEFGYENVGLIFFTNGYSLNSILLVFIAILVILIYCRVLRTYKKNIVNSYKVNLYIDDKVIKLNGYLDSGNNLYDNYFNKPIIILNNNIKVNYSNCFFVSYNTISGSDVMTCFFVKKVFIEGVGFKYNLIIGLSNDKFLLNDADIILHKDLMEG